MKKFKVLVLCGLPMCGKTSVGKILSETLKWNFIDTDRLIEKTYFSKTRKLASCREIFKNEGQDFFRSLESEIIFSLKPIDHNIIAIGGGTLTHQANLETLQNLGTIIYLKASPSIIFERIESNGLPAFLRKEDPQKSLQELAEKRIPIYEECADHIIDTSNLNEKEVVNKILSIFP